MRWNYPSFGVVEKEPEIYLRSPDLQCRRFRQTVRFETAFGQAMRSGLNSLRSDLFALCKP